MNESVTLRKAPADDITLAVTMTVQHPRHRLIDQTLRHSIEEWRDRKLFFFLKVILLKKKKIISDFGW